MRPYEKKLLELLSNNEVTFFIPPYQRNYEWTHDQCKVFLDDMVKLYEANVAGAELEHFFGTITYFQSHTAFDEPDKLVLIDGQQRITTTMLFLVALRDMLPETRRERIDTKYLKNPNAGADTAYKIKLKQVETDWEAYKKIILGEKLTEENKRSQVFRNYTYFKNFLAEYNDAQAIGDFIEYGLAKFSVVTIELEPSINKWENPQEIFESMNSLGKPLSLADLVRNYLLLGLNAETQDRLYRTYWLPIERHIPPQVKISNFIRDYMQGIAKGFYEKATEAKYKKLYADFKELFEDYEAEPLLASMEDYAVIYSWIVTSASTGSKEIDGLLADLRVLKSATIYSFLLMLLHDWQDGKFSDGDIITILKVLRVYFMRLRILGIGAGGNKKFPSLTAQIPSLMHASEKAKKLFAILAEQEFSLRVPNDDEISAAMSEMNFYNFEYVKFYLAIIEEYLTRARPDATDSNLQIEHIMPQSLDGNWYKELGPAADDVQQKYLHNIGNLTLIRHNRELSNHSFAEKLAIYKNNAGLQLAKSNIVDKTVWGEAEICKRRDWLINILVENIMTIPKDMRHRDNFKGKRVAPESGNKFSFQAIGLVNVDINYIPNPTIIARVIDDKHVEFEGKSWTLSGLVRELKRRDGTKTKSEAYQGSQYFEYEGEKLATMFDRVK